MTKLSKLGFPQRNSKQRGIVSTETIFL